MEASDRLSLTDLVVVQNTFQRETFEAAKIYFLNTQKLSKGSLLVRGFDPEEDGLEQDDRQASIMPDLRVFTIWDTIRNTIEDPNLTLYLVLDEAHRGMKESGKNDGDGKSTIVKRLINGERGIPGIPVVWGISATVERFNAAMADMAGRATLPNILVDTAKVQASGLLKDTIILDVPGEVARVETVLVRRGTDKLKELSQAWAAYFEQQEDAIAVCRLWCSKCPIPQIIMRLAAISTPSSTIGPIYRLAPSPTFSATIPHRPSERIRFHTYHPSACRSLIGSAF